MTTKELDATGQSLGRLASKIAMMLRGKDTPQWEPRIIPDVQVVVHNLDKVVFKGTKLQSMIHYTHSKYPGSLKERTLEQRWEKDPVAVLRQTVRGMLPENKQRDKLLKNLIVQ